MLWYLEGELRATTYVLFGRSGCRE